MPDPDHPDPAGRARLAVLMATYQAGDRLGAQLDSIAAQTRPPEMILASDDGSSDGTPVRLRDWAARHPAIEVRRFEGPRRGAAANFLSLIARAPDTVERLSLADQDDVWLPGKLDRAGTWLDGADARAPDRPALYCARVWICDDALRGRTPTGLPARPLSFRNALTQNVACGNTIVLNRAASDLARGGARALEAEGALPVLHDWWLYQLVTGAGGAVFFDPEPQVLYRQHGGNVIGANTGARAKLARIARVLDGTYGRWNAANLAALEATAALLTPENRALAEGFARARRAGFAERMALLRRLGLYRQGRGGQASLWAAALLGRL